MRFPDEAASLASLAEEAGHSVADVALLADVEESTVSRLWPDPGWLDRITGGTLQRIMAAVPGVTEYVSSQPIAARLSALAAELAAAGIDADPDGIRAAQAAGVEAAHVANALNAALHTVRGDPVKAGAHLARLWGRQQDEALTRLFSAGGDGMLANPERLVEASADLAPRLRHRGYSLYGMLAVAAIVHHAPVDQVPATADGARDRQGAMSLRSTYMGTLIRDGDFDSALRYEQLTRRMPLLAVIEEWSHPTYSRDIRPDSSFSLPRSILLRNTAVEVIREIDGYSDAYVHYLLSVYLPLALARDPTFGLARAELAAAIRERLNRDGDPRLRAICETTLHTLEGIK
jgi:hypothetical protein